MYYTIRISLILTILLFQLPLISFADNYDFRKTRGGMTQAQVKASESNTLASNNVPSKIFDKVIAYEGGVAGYSTFYGYRFISNQLVEAGYVFLQKHSNKNDYIYDYKKIKKILTEKYGEPTEDDIIWKKSLYRDDPERYGMAVARGDLIYATEWLTPSTKIYLTLMGDNYNIDMKLQYQSLRLKSLVEKKSKQKYQEGL